MNLLKKLQTTKKLNMKKSTNETKALKSSYAFVPVFGMAATLCNMFNVAYAAGIKTPSMETLIKDIFKDVIFKLFKYGGIGCAAVALFSFGMAYINNDESGKNRGFVCTIGAIILIGIPALIKKWFGL